MSAAASDPASRDGVANGRATAAKFRLEQSKCAKLRKLSGALSAVSGESSRSFGRAPAVSRR
jgi:hypothetical protein